MPCIRSVFIDVVWNNRVRSSARSPGEMGCNSCLLDTRWAGLILSSVCGLLITQSNALNRMMKQMIRGNCPIQYLDRSILLWFTIDGFYCVSGIELIEWFRKLCICVFNRQPIQTFCHLSVCVSTNQYDVPSFEDQHSSLTRGVRCLLDRNQRLFLGRKWKHMRMKSIKLYQHVWLQSECNYSIHYPQHMNSLNPYVLTICFKQKCTKSLSVYHLWKQISLPSTFRFWHDQICVSRDHRLPL